MSPTPLEVGLHAVLDPATSGGCLSLAAAGAAGAEYLVAVVSANGQATDGGVSGVFELRGEAASLPATGRVRGAVSLVGGAPDGAEAFHASRRGEEAAHARSLGLTPGLPGRSSRSVTRPSLGVQRTFSVCASLACDGFTPVSATARFVGGRVALFLDDSVPAGGYTPEELDSLGVLLDEHLYPIDTTAFGAESDLDGNGVVAVLLTDGVNALSNCAATGTIVRGYFSSRDLGTAPHSNLGEVIYAMVPDPGVPQCFGKGFVKGSLGPTFAHEFQHLISFHRHARLGGGLPEESWLNEGLSHFAEELAARQVPAALCADANCLNQYAAANVRNAFSYLSSPADWSLVFARGSTGQLAERGAAWLFVRWLADRSTTDSLLATDITRRLTGADHPAGLTRTGGANVEAALQAVAPGITFATLVGRWHLSNWTERVTGLDEPGGWLRYRSWNLPSAFDQLFPGPYPLIPDSTSGAGFRMEGGLHGGSAAYLRVVQPADGPAVRLGVSTRSGSNLVLRLAVVRLR